mmetsp:Transcript_21239/g.26802  ORF Transcript_21239/g.26802 Transcript_21239/m.26802 type:complete len:200 (-) Transcript_21239:2-601(-)
MRSSDIFFISFSRAVKEETRSSHLSFNDSASSRAFCICDFAKFSSPSISSFCLTRSSRSDLSWIPSFSAFSFSCIASFSTLSFAFAARRAMTASCSALFSFLSNIIFSCSSCSLSCLRCSIVDNDFAFISSFSALCCCSLILIPIKESHSFSDLSSFCFACSLLCIRAFISFFILCNFSLVIESFPASLWEEGDGDKDT